MTLELNNTGNSGVVEPEQSGRKPIALGRRKPSRFRREVIGSMAAAAADLERNSVGKGHKLGLNAFARTPTTTISAREILASGCSWSIDEAMI